MPGLLNGDTALITGAAAGIGRSIALALAREGAQLALTDIQQGLGEDVATATNGAFIHADLADPEAYKEVFSRAAQALGRITVFVHCAAPPPREDQTALAATAEQWDQTMSVILRSGFLLGQEVGRHMRDARLAGRMLYITSLHADTPRNLADYSAAKAGSAMLVKEFARALGPCGIRVNAIAPGAISDDNVKANLDEFTKKVPLRRMGLADEVASMAVALLSDRFSAYVTGATIRVDGGLALHNWIEAN